MIRVMCDGVVFLILAPRPGPLLVWRGEGELFCGTIGPGRPPLFHYGATSLLPWAIVFRFVGASVCTAFLAPHAREIQSRGSAAA